MNSVHLIGRLATDVEVKEVNGGSKVSSFILAVDRNQEEADFFRIKRGFFDFDDTPPKAVPTACLILPDP